MKKIKALFIDCDGVLYDKKNCTYEDIAVIGFGKTLDQFGITRERADKRHAELKAKNIHGLYNVVLDLSRQDGFSFSKFAAQMIQNVDYSRIPQDKALLSLLKQIGQKMPVYFVTNNTYPHLLRILSCLNGRPVRNVFKEFHIIPITLEKTLHNNVFHPKKTEHQFLNLCTQIGQMPYDVLLLDDTGNVCAAAKQQGLNVIQIQGPEQTKQIIRGVLNETSNNKRPLSVRKTRRGSSR